MRSFDEFRKTRKSEKPARPPDLRLMVQAEVEAGLLMADKHWSLYQSYLQKGINDLSGFAESAMAELKEPACSSVERIMWLKSAIHGFEQQAEALRWALRLPLDIVENGERAKNLIEETS